MYVELLLELTKSHVIFCSLSACNGDACVSSCDEGWKQFGNNCYLFKLEKKTWTAAEDFCLNEGGHLASIASKAINTFIGDEMYPEDFWVGGNDRGREGTWKWTDCTPWEFAFWGSGEPNNVDHSGNSQNCMKYRRRTKWDDDTCSKDYEFVCSKKLCTGPILILKRNRITTIIN